VLKSNLEDIIFEKDERSTIDGSNITRTPSKSLVPVKESNHLEIPQIDSSLGCADAIRTLLKDSWGRASPKSKDDLKRAMKLNAIHLPDSTIRSTLTQLTKRNDLRRIKDNGVYRYIFANED